MRKYFLYILALGILVSCAENKTERNLDAGEREFLEGLGLLNPKEEVEIFENNDGFEDVTKSGNFITQRRIASYWIEDGEKELNQAYFETEIDSISQTDNHRKLTYASYLTIYKTDGSTFKVYVDADSSRTHAFFHQALSNWERFRKNK